MMRIRYPNGMVTEFEHANFLSESESGLVDAYTEEDGEHVFTVMPNSNVVIESGDFDVNVYFITPPQNVRTNTL